MIPNTAISPKATRKVACPDTSQACSFDAAKGVVESVSSLCGHQMTVRFRLVRSSQDKGHAVENKLETDTQSVAFNQEWIQVEGVSITSAIVELLKLNFVGVCDTILCVAGVHTSEHMCSSSGLLFSEVNLCQSVS